MSWNTYLRIFGLASSDKRPQRRNAGGGAAVLSSGN